MCHFKKREELGDEDIQMGVILQAKGHSFVV